MAKGYWIVRIDIRDLDSYLKEYVPEIGPIFAKYGAKFLVRGVKRETFETKEGTSRHHNVVIEFKDYQTALACYGSPEYQRMVAIRARHSEGDLIVIEGYDGPQP